MFNSTNIDKCHHLNLLNLFHTNIEFTMELKNNFNFSFSGHFNIFIKPKATAVLSIKTGALAIKMNTSISLDATKQAEL